MFAYIARTTGLSTRVIKSITAALALVSALGGAIGAASNIEPYTPAHRLYVRDYSTTASKAEIDKLRLAETAVERSLYSIQIEQAEGKREAADNDLFKAQLEQKRATDDNTKAFIDDQIRKLQYTRDKLDKQLDTLTKSAPK